MKMQMEEAANEKAGTVELLQEIHTKAMRAHALFSALELDRIGGSGDEVGVLKRLHEQAYSNIISHIARIGQETVEEIGSLIEQVEQQERLNIA